ncbi:hypothetical protein WDU94_011342 [Cyamophila willieti]
MLVKCFVFGALCCVPWIHLSEQSKAQHCDVKVSPDASNGKVETCLHSGQDSAETPQPPDMSSLFSIDLVRSIIPHIEDSTCRGQLSHAVQDLDEMKLWAFQMFDSTGSLSSSVLSGNSHQLGDFDQCLSIQHPRIRTQYCLGLVDVEATEEAPQDVKLVVERIRGNNFIQSHRSNPSHFIPTYTTLKWGLCIPDSCSPSDLIQTKVDPSLCQQGGLTSQHKAWPLSTYLAILFFGSLVMISLVSTYHDQNKVPINKLSKYGAFQVLCSIKRNWAQFLFFKKEDIGCIHGLKTLATFLLFFAHNVIPLGSIPFINRTQLTDITFAPISSIFRSSIVYTDTFLLLSGLLSSYYLQTTSSILSRIGNRLIRMIPAHLAVILFTANILPYLNSGPLWHYIVETNVQLCARGWWKNLLFIHNFYPFDEMCAPHTHHLALDVQLFLLTIPLVLGLKSHPGYTSITLLGLNLGSAMFRYSAMIEHRLSLVIYTGASLQDLYKSADLSYIRPLHRASPYLSGVWLGFMLYKIKFHPIKLSKTTLYTGWSLTTLCLSYCLMANYNVGAIDYKYDVTQAAHYAALCPLLTSAALSWVILVCSTGYGGFVNSFLSCKVMCLLSKMSFSIYLVQFCVFFYNLGIIRTSRTFSVSYLVSFEELLITILVSFVLTLLVDLPVQNFKTLIFR